jgi:hypothetical protein
VIPALHDDRVDDTGQQLLELVQLCICDIRALSLRVHTRGAERTRKLPIGLEAIAAARTMGARCCRSG